MQNMYVGDIGDYGKYGLLRALLPDYKLGIVWYLVPDEKHLTDGRHTNYLSKLKYKDYDPQLFSVLENIISSGKRKISQIEKSQLFPVQTIYYSDGLSYKQLKGENRLIKREKWLSRALQAVHNCDAVFLDPDNGLEILSVNKCSAKAPKYVYYDEVEKFLTITDTLIIYHHLGRRESHLSQIKHRLKVLQTIADKPFKIVTLRFSPYSPRAYFVITKNRTIIDRIRHFITTNWQQCFEVIE